LSNSLSEIHWRIATIISKKTQPKQLITWKKDFLYKLALNKLVNNLPEFYKI